MGKKPSPTTAKCWLYKTLGGGVLLYGLIVILITATQNYLLFPGITLNKEDCALAATPWNQYSQYIERGDARCQGWLIDAPNKPLLFYLGGNHMDTASQLPWLSSLKIYAVATMNYRGFGQSTGTPSQTAVVNDAIAFLDQLLAQTGRTSKDVILVGESIGAGVATQVATQRPVNKLILLVPFESMINIAQEKIPFIPMNLLLWNSFESQKAALHITASTTIIAAQNDKLIPPYHAKRLAQAFLPPAHYIEIPQVGHKNLRQSPLFHRAFAQICLPTP